MQSLLSFIHPIALLVSTFASMQVGFAQTPNKTEKTMKIEIWSDVACPFCYIGQAHLMEALSTFPEKDKIEIEWKSFILDPTLPQQTDDDLFTVLSERKGMPMEQVMQMTAHVENMASKAGLQLNFKKTVPVNTLKAHALLQLAKEKGKGNEAKQRLFKAYFEEGANLGKDGVLIALGKDLNLAEAELKNALSSDAYRLKVQGDVNTARQLGVSGVPFFVLDGKYSISGAQPTATMKQALAQAFAEWNSAAKPSTAVVEGAACKPEGDCD